MKNDGYQTSPLQPDLRLYYTTAAKSPSPLEIEPGSNEWASWALYFDEVYGRRPAAMVLREKGMCKSFCVPAQWPEWFDTTFAMGGPAMGKGAAWSEEAALKFLATRRVADDAIEGGWISALVDHVRAEHAAPHVAHIAKMQDDARRFDERLDDINSGRFGAGMAQMLGRLGNAMIDRRARYADEIRKYRSVYAKPALVASAPSRNRYQEAAE
jgi:hypothetical protein